MEHFHFVATGLDLTRIQLFDLIDLYFKLCGTNMLHKKQIMNTIYNEVTASGKRGSSNASNMFCALEY